MLICRIVLVGPNGPVGGGAIHLKVETEARAWMAGIVAATGLYCAEIWLGRRLLGRVPAPALAVLQ